MPGLAVQQDERWVQDMRGGGVHSGTWHYAQNSYSVLSRKSRRAVTAGFFAGESRTMSAVSLTDRAYLTLVALMVRIARLLASHRGNKS